MAVKDVNVLKKKNMENGLKKLYSGNGGESDGSIEGGVDEGRDRERGINVWTAA